jgi:ABC-type transport system substrate-binding protein
MESVKRVRWWSGAVVWSLMASACAGSAGVAPVGTDAGTIAPDTTTSVVATQAPYRSAYGGTVVVGVADGGAPRGLNPFIEGPDSAVLDLIAPAVFAQGYDTDPVTGERLPDALAALPSLESGTLIDNGDGTVTVTVTVVAGAQWADGTPMTGADLEFTLSVATNPALPIRADIVAQYAAVVPGSTRVDGQSLTLRMRAGSDPGALFEFIIPRHDVEATDFAADWNDVLWTSGGPFVVGDWEPGQFVELVRNDNYWKVTAAEGAPLPFLDRVVVRFFEPGEDLDARLVDGFERGDLDVVVFDRAEQRAGALGDAVVAGATVESVPTGAWDHLNFQFGPANRNEVSLNARREMRQAVAYAIDRDALAYERGTVRVDSVLAQYLPGIATAAFERYEADPEKVRSLLYDIEVATGRDMFAGDGPPVIVTLAADVASTVALGGDIVVMLREVGIGAQLQLEGSELFFGSTLDNGSWDVSAWTVGAGTGLGAAMDFIRVYDPDGLPFVGDNYFRWGTLDSTVSDAATSRYREIVDELDQTVDPVAITALLVEAEQILADEAVMLPLVVAHLAGTGYWPTAVTGVASNPHQGVLWNVDVWRTAQVSG